MPLFSISSFDITEMKGFEPPDRLPDQLISSQPRYDHFGTSPFTIHFIIHDFEEM